MYQLAELGLMESLVHAAGCQQFLMMTLFSDAIFRDDDDPVRILNRSQPMGDHKRCASFRQLLQRFLNGGFRFCIEG